MEQFLKEIGQLVQEEKYEVVLLRFEEKIIELQQINSCELDDVLYEYAYILLDFGMHEDGVQILKSLYNKGYRKDDIEEYFENAFILPNKEEFYKTYQENINKLIKIKKNILINNYEKLVIDFIPINEDKYIIWDRAERIMKNLVDISEEYFCDLEQLTTSIECSDILIKDSWNIFDKGSKFFAYKDKVIYFIPDDLLRFNCFFKLPKFYELVYNNIFVFYDIETCQSYFHSNTDVYLPRMLYADDEINRERLEQIVKEEHEYRLTSEGRNESNILLTIGIPSFNRGHRALQTVNYILQTFFDCEIEVVVSDNCSIRNTDGYDKIAQIQDSRLKYYRHNNNPGENRNFDTVFKLAKGKFVCLLSDEDLINYNMLHHYIELCKRDNIGMIVASGSAYYSNSIDHIFKAGDEAFYAVTASLNYISGLIYNKLIYDKYKFYEWSDQQVYYSNFYIQTYAHNAWAMYYAMEKDIMIDSTLFIISQEAEEEYSDRLVSKDSSKDSIALHMTYPHRLLQFMGLIELINNFSDRINKDTVISLYLKIVEKQFFLLNLVRERVATPWKATCDCIKVFSIDRIKELNIKLNFEERQYMIKRIEEYYIEYMKIKSF